MAVDTDIRVVCLPTKEQQGLPGAPGDGKGQEGGSPRSSCISTLAVWLGVGSLFLSIPEHPVYGVAKCGNAIIHSIHSLVAGCLCKCYKSPVLCALEEEEEEREQGGRRRGIKDKA